MIGTKSLSSDCSVTTIRHWQNLFSTKRDHDIFDLDRWTSCQKVWNNLARQKRTIQAKLTMLCYDWIPTLYCWVSVRHVSAPDGYLRWENNVHVHLYAGNNYVYLRVQVICNQETILRRASIYYLCTRATNWTSPSKMCLYLIFWNPLNKATFLIIVNECGTKVQ